uniref:Uncharacterized protein MANES_01G189300 n=1 Tax=Rhizophora mucronata TaxID=61149 RepID=A0A2P2K4H5_RHIMU
MLQLNSLCAQPSAQNPKLCLHTSNLSHGSSFSARRYGLSVAKASGKNKLAVKSRQSEYYEQQRFAASRPSSTNSTFAPQSPLPVGVGDVSPRVFVGHSIYKGKAALTVEPRAPEFAALASGAFKLAKEGFLLLQFAPAASPRQYDWNRKQVFSLSVTEIGNLVSLNTRDSCEFFHDPNKGRSDEGKVRKVLRVEPLPDGSGHFFNLSNPLFA